MGVGSTHRIEALEDYPQVASPKECQTNSHGMDPPTQMGSCRRNPEVEGQFVCWRSLPGVWQHLLDHLCPSGVMDNSLVHFHHGLVVGVAHEVH